MTRSRVRHAALSSVLTLVAGTGLLAAGASTGGSMSAPAAAAAATARADGASARRLDNGCRYSKRGLPRCGVLVGATYGANADPSPVERRAGRQLGVRRTFYTADQVDGAVRKAREDARAGRLPWISFKLPTSWGRMAAGAGDAWTRDLARRLDRVPGPVWLAFHHEPEGDGNIKQWRRMQERLGPIVRRTADNVGFTVVLTGWNQLYGDRAYRLSRIWPRTKVDVAGFDVYNEYGVTKNGRTIDEWPGIGRNYFKPLGRWARRQGVAWGLAETALTDEAAAARPRWIERAVASMERHGGIAFTYFDTWLNAYGSWELGTGAKQRGFLRALRSSPARH